MIDLSKYQTVTEVLAPGEYDTIAVALDVAMVVPGESDDPSWCMSLAEYRYLMLHGVAYVPVAVAGHAVTPSTTARTVGR